MLPSSIKVDDLSWPGVVEADLTKLFEQLEFRTLKDRLKPILNPDSVVKKQESIEEFTLFAPTVEGGVLTPAEIDARISTHQGEIAVAFEMRDEKLHRYAIAFSPTDVQLIHSSQMGEWAQE
jgi:DNA polymerase I